MMIQMPCKQFKRPLLKSFQPLVWLLEPQSCPTAVMDKQLSLTNSLRPLRLKMMQLQTGSLTRLSMGKMTKKMDQGSRRWSKLSRSMWLKMRLRAETSFLVFYSSPQLSLRSLSLLSSVSAFIGHSLPKEKLKCTRRLKRGWLNPRDHSRKMKTVRLKLKRRSMQKHSTHLQELKKSFTVSASLCQ